MSQKAKVPTGFGPIHGSEVRHHCAAIWDAMYLLEEEVRNPAKWSVFGIGRQNRAGVNDVGRFVI
jgi:hypothetical protein